MKTLITCTVNGQEHTVLADTRDTLLDLLRERIGLTGTKEGCGNGNCGTCTVHHRRSRRQRLPGARPRGPGSRHRHHRRPGAGGTLHPIQQALVEHGGTQCGFCTPGIVLSAKALLDDNPNPTAQDVRQAMAGNICRCTGYDKIVDAVMAAAATQQTQER